MKCGAYAEAERALREALANAERAGLLYVMTAAKHNLGLALARLGALDQALAVEDDALTLAQAQGDPRIEGGSRIYLAMIQQLRGELVEAEKEARDALAVLKAVPPTYAVACAVLAGVLLQKRAPREALAVASEAIGLLESLGGLEEGEALVRLVHAEALNATGDAEGARLAIRAAKVRLEERAGRLREGPLKTSFLENIPEHSRTFSRAREWGA
jgi:hypothetical protein